MRPTTVFKNYILEKGLLNQDETHNLIENDRESLLRIIWENDAAVSNVSPGITLLESLKFAVDRQGIAHSIEGGRSYFPEERRAFSSRDPQNYSKRNSH